MVNRVSSYFPKGGHSATQTELKIINMNTRKVKRHRNSDTKTENHNKITALDRYLMDYWGCLNQFNGYPNLMYTNKI